MFGFKTRQDPRGDTEMKHTRRGIAVLFFSLMTAMTIDVALSHAQASACPVLEDQLVIVEEGRPIGFRLQVDGLGDGDIGIFQYPERGILEQAGSSPLDFVFVPASNFNGTTEFTYRVIPPASCRRAGVLFGHVTIAGGTAAGTAIGLAPPAGLCGIGPLGLMTLALGMLGMMRICSWNGPQTHITSAWIDR